MRRLFTRIKKKKKRKRGQLLPEHGLLYAGLLIVLLLGCGFVWAVQRATIPFPPTFTPYPTKTWLPAELAQGILTAQADCPGNDPGAEYGISSRYGYYSSSYSPDRLLEVVVAEGIPTATLQIMPTPTDYIPGWLNCNQPHPPSLIHVPELDDHFTCPSDFHVLPRWMTLQDFVDDYLAMRAVHTINISVPFNITSITWSPDNRHLAFVAPKLSNDAGGAAIMIVDILDGKVLEGSYTHHAGFDYTLAWSPDGTQLAFSQNTGTRPSGHYHGPGPSNYKILIITLDDPGEPRYAMDGCRPRWTP